MKPLVDTRVLNPAQTAVPLGLITEMDFLRLKAIARQLREGVTMVAFLAVARGRSLRCRIRPGTDAERPAELKLIERLFTEDPIALEIIAGIGKGLSAEQIRNATHLSKRDYDSTRKRIRRTLLREGSQSLLERGRDRRDGEAQQQPDRGRNHCDPIAALTICSLPQFVAGRIASRLGAKNQRA